MWKKISSGLYFVAFVLFFTPWWSASCGGQKFLSVTGIQTATGVEVQSPGGMQKIPSAPAIIVAGMLIVIGIIAGLMIKDAKSIIPAFPGIIAGILLLIFKTKLDADAVKQGQGVVQVTFENGFWAAIFTAFAAAVVNFLPENKTDNQAGKATNS